MKLFILVFCYLPFILVQSKLMLISDMYNDPYYYNSGCTNNTNIEKLLDDTIKWIKLNINEDLLIWNGDVKSTNKNDFIKLFF